MQRTIRTSTVALTASVLLLAPLAACEDDGDGIDDDVEQDIEDGVNDVQDSISEGIDEIQDGVEEELDGEPDDDGNGG
jgi:hypothetical protein